jgi:uroporphyrinogen decarboxylase
MLYDRPDLLHRILAINAEAVALYLNAQIDAGAQAVMLFDSWAACSPTAPSSASAWRTCNACWPGCSATPTAGACRRSSSPRAAGPGSKRSPARRRRRRRRLDVHLGQARQRVGEGVALQGNLDPNVLFARPAAIRNEVAAVLASFHAGPASGRNGHVFNLGHGISQHTPPEHVAVLVDAVHELSGAYQATSRP